MLTARKRMFIRLQHLMEYDYPTQGFFESDSSFEKKMEKRYKGLDLVLGSERITSRPKSGILGVYAVTNDGKYKRL